MFKTKRILTLLLPRHLLTLLLRICEVFTHAVR